MKLRFFQHGLRIKKNSPFEIRRSKSFHAYTLIELMIVVAIIGLIAAMGVPALDRMLIKRGMRKAISEITETCESARAKAIFTGHKVAIVIRPSDRSFAVEGGGVGHGSPYVSSGTLPADVELEALGINSLDYTESELGRVFFYANGTSDEMTLVLHSRNDWSKITLEFATGYPTVSDVAK